MTAHEKSSTDDAVELKYPIAARITEKSRLYATEQNVHFTSPESWLAAYHQALREGRRPWPPQTADEFRLAERDGLLEQHPQWLPCRIGLRLLGLPDWFGRRPEPYAAWTQERFLATLMDQPDFAMAVRAVLRQVASSSTSRTIAG